MLGLLSFLFAKEETVYEENEDNGKIPYVTAETNPQVEGVLVIAEGGGNGYIKQEIIEAAQALFGIDAHKIKIMKINQKTNPVYP